MNEDFLDLLSALLDAEARFLLVGAYAVAAHGHPRATKDLDVFVEATPDNAHRVFAALRSFGAPLFGMTEQDISSPGKGLMMGVAPRRIDIITKISGVEFADAWAHRIECDIGGVPCPVIGLDELIDNKRAAGRAQDLADLERPRDRSTSPPRQLFRSFVHLQS
jgi:hypothetical protein